MIAEDLKKFTDEWLSDVPAIEVHTSGSTGRPTRIQVEKSRMRHSAALTMRTLGLNKGGTALLCMPLQYIGGKMMVVRALEWGMQLIAVEPSGHPLSDIDQPITLAAMVPMQVWNSLQVPEERKRLQGIQHLLIGGGAINEQLAAALRPFTNAVWSTYGMTETVSHIALRRLSGPKASEWYTPMEGINVSLHPLTDALVIDAPQLTTSALFTHDIARFNDQGQFRILGRTDNTICSGGVKIQTEEMETLLCQSLGDTIMVTSRPDEKFGEALVLLTTRPIDKAYLQSLLAQHPYWYPKNIIVVAGLPRTGNGKPDRFHAKEIARRLSR